MRNWQSTSLKVMNDQLWILDQQALPQKINWLPAHTVEQLVSHIQHLRVRGAPLIGLSACLLLALLAEQGQSKQDLHRALVLLRHSRPTAVNLVNNLALMEQALSHTDFVGKLSEQAWQLLVEDQQLCARIAEFGSELVKPSSRLLTHCNTGGLATVGIGTALGVIFHAFAQGNIQHVWVNETRPLLQGARLTTWELAEHNIPYQLICDSMAASLMAQNLIDAVWVGADRIAMNGDVANKIGTYNLAVLAHYHGIPFYVAAPHTTIDPHCLHGKAIPIEQRVASEVLGVHGSFGEIKWAPEHTLVWNPAFDVTPAELITAWVLDSGCMRLPDIRQGKLHSSSSKLGIRL